MSKKLPLNICLMTLVCPVCNSCLRCPYRCLAMTGFSPPKGKKEKKVESANRPRYTHLDLTINPGLISATWSTFALYFSFTISVHYPPSTFFHLHTAR
jgi:hypothetical protein